MTSLIRRTSSPFYLSEVMDKVFQDFFNDSFFTTSIPKIPYQERFHFQVTSYPVSNLYIEKDGTSVYEIAVTGFDKDEINIEIEGKTLIVTGTKKEEDNNEERGYVYKKLTQKNFSVDAALKDCQDINNISTSLKNGLLTIRIPLREEEKLVKKQISIG
jgi:HSP20 family molecular chaperone IbpA